MLFFKITPNPHSKPEYQSIVWFGIHFTDCSWPNYFISFQLICIYLMLYASPLFKGWISYLSLFDLPPILNSKVSGDTVSFIILKQLLAYFKLISASSHILPLFPLLIKIHLAEKSPVLFSEMKVRHQLCCFSTDTDKTPWNISPHSTNAEPSPGPGWGCLTSSAPLASGPWRQRASANFSRMAPWVRRWHKALHSLDTMSPHFATAPMIWLPEKTAHDPQSKFRYS